jgi:hypothetical protein
MENPDFKIEKKKAASWIKLNHKHIQQKLEQQYWRMNFNKQGQ